MPTRRQLKDWLGQFGLSGDVMQLIDAAVRHDWSTTHVVQRLVRTDTFHHLYPGLVRNGNIQPFLLNKAGAPLTVQNLAQAVGNYQTLEQQYKTISQTYGYKWKPNMMLNAIQNNIAPTEFKQRLQAVQTVNQTPGLKEFYAQALKNAGIHGVDTQREMFRLAAGVAGRKFEDIYETARLAQGVGFSVKEAAQLSKQIGQPGEAIDIGALVTQVKQQIGDIGPELQRAGISNADLTRFLANPQDDPLGLTGRLASIVSARRAQGANVPGTQITKGPGGGPTIYQPEAAAAY